MDSATLKTDGALTHCKRASITTSFITSVVVILIITGGGKIWSAFGKAKITAVADPITGVQFGHLILLVGILEIIVASICLFDKRQKVALLSTAWLATTLALYRFGLWWIEWQRPCSCMGNLTDVLHISPQAADIIMKIILAYLLLGSYVGLFWLRRQSPKAFMSATPSLTP